MFVYPKPCLYVGLREFSNCIFILDGMNSFINHQEYSDHNLSVYVMKVTATTVIIYLFSNRAFYFKQTTCDFVYIVNYVNENTLYFNPHICLSRVYYLFCVISLLVNRYF